MTQANKTTRTPAERMWKGSSALLQSIGEEQLKKLIKTNCEKLLEQGILLAPAALATISLWPAALVLAVCGAGFLIWKSKSTESAGMPQIDQATINELLKALKDHKPDHNTLNKQITDLGLTDSEKINDIRESVDALNELINIHHGEIKAIAADIKRNVADFDKQFSTIKGSLDIITDFLPDIYVNLRHVVNLLTGGPRFEPFYVEKSASNRYLYSLERVELAGREKEVQTLEKFLADKRQSCWMVITGPGGMGKSRLAFHLCRQAEAQGWLAGKIDSNQNPENWNNWRPERDALLFIDYAESKMDKFSGALQAICRQNHDDKKIRLLMIARSDDTWLNTFIGDEAKKEVVNSARFSHTLVPQGIMSLQPLDETSLWRIVTNIAKLRQAENPQYSISWSEKAVTANGKTYTRTIVVDAMKRLDTTCRPLFAAFSADAIMDGKDIRTWNQHHLMEHVLGHEKTLWAKVCHKDFEKYEALIALSTFCRGLNLYRNNGNDRPVSAYPKSELIAGFIPEYSVPCKKLMEYMLGRRGADDQLPFLEPDLLGELFVTDFLKDKSAIEQQEFFRTGIINNPVGAALFVALAPRDYHKSGIVSTMYQYTIDSVIDKFEAIACAQYVVAAAFLLPPEISARLYASLKTLVYSEPWKTHQEINLEFANAAVNLVSAHGDANNPEQAATIYGDLKILVHTNFAAVSEINLPLANAAFNLVKAYGDANNPKQAVAIYSDLKTLARTGFAAVSEINLPLAKAAVNLVTDYCKVKNFEQAVMIYDDLKILAHKDFTADREINLQFAKATNNLVNAYGDDNNPEQAAMIYDDLKKLVRTNFATNREINLALAQAAVNLVGAYGKANNPEQAATIYGDLKILVHTNFAAVSEINLALAQAAFNLVSAYGKANNPKQAAVIYSDLKNLASADFAAVRKINLEFANAAINLVSAYDYANDPEQAAAIYGDLDSTCWKWIELDAKEFLNPILHGFCLIMQIKHFRHPGNATRVLDEFKKLDSKTYKTDEDVRHLVELAAQYHNIICQ